MQDNFTYFAGFCFLCTASMCSPSKKLSLILRQFCQYITQYDKIEFYITHMKKWNLGSLRLHLLAFQAPYSERLSGGHRVCRTCSATCYIRDYAH